MASRDPNLLLKPDPSRDVMTLAAPAGSDTVQEGGKNKRMEKKIKPMGKKKTLQHFGRVEQQKRCLAAVDAAP